MKYGLDDKPPLIPLLLYGLQWWIVSLPCLVVLGAVVAHIHHPDLAGQTWYLQKLFGLTGAVVIIQVLWGHRLPLVAGPAAALLVGMVAAAAPSFQAVHTSLLAGGLCMALVAATGLMTRLRALFTPRIVAVILVLIALTMAPTILRLALPADAAPQTAAFHLSFALLTAFVMAICNFRLPGTYKSLTVFIGMAGGSLCYFLIAGFPQLTAIPPGAAALPLFISALDFDAGTMLAFLFSFLALTINEIGSIEAVGHMLRAPRMPSRLRSGTAVQGAANMAAGALGVIGSVDFSLSAGVIVATGCASRYTLLPAGGGLLLCACLPQVVRLLACIPGPVMGALLLYLMATQLIGGLGLLVAEKGIADFAGGITVGLPLMTGLLVAMAPPDAFAGFPALLRPIVGNGFVMGAITVIFLEHGIFRKNTGA